MTYGETVAACEAHGLTLCQQSCKNTGCYYNRHPVYPSLPCDAAAPSPPSPPPPPVATPHPPWAPSTLPSTQIREGEDEATHLERCKATCAESAVPSACDGFTTVSVNGAAACVYHVASATSFFQPA